MKGSVLKTFHLTGLFVKALFMAIGASLCYLCYNNVLGFLVSWVSETYEYLLYQNITLFTLLFDEGYTSPRVVLEPLTSIMIIIRVRGHRL